MRTTLEPVSDPRFYPFSEVISRSFWGVSMRISCLAVFLLFVVVHAVALSNPTIPSSWYDDAQLRDVHFVDANYGWAVGDQGTIWHTQNGGEIWRRQTSAVYCQLTSVDFVDRLVGYAAGGTVVPGTLRSKAVLLRTADGGKTWENTSGLLLPWLTKVHFVNAKRGYAAGMSSSTYPNAVWSTRDGGRTWSPISGVAGVHWADASFHTNAKTGATSGLFLSRNGTRAWLSGDRLLRAGNSFESEPKTSKRRDGIVRNSVYGAIVSSSVAYAGVSQPNFSGDGGNTWQPTGPIPYGTDFQPRTMVTRKGECWLAGSPGTRMMYSADMGGTWQLRTTPATMPIEKLFFLDDALGWAVGARGMILSTKDGGSTWKTQRGGAKRTALVGLFADERDVPWELLTQVSAQDAYRTHIVVLAARDQDPLQCAVEERVRAAAQRIGATAEVLTQLPYPDGVEANAADLLAKWRGEDEQVVERLSRSLTHVIRVHRPDVIVTSQVSPPDSASKSAQQVIARLIQDAVEYASIPKVYAEQIESLGLQPWTVSRTMAVQTTEGKPIALDSVATVLGTSVRDLSRQAASRVVETSRLHPTRGKRWSLLSLNDNGKAMDYGRRPLSASSIAYDTAQRRPRTIQSVDLASQKKSLQHLLQTRRILLSDSIVGRGEQRIQQIERLLAHEPTVLGNLLFEAAMNEISRGDFDEADKLLSHLTKAHPTHERVASSLHLLVAYRTSMEYKWLHPESSQSKDQKPSVKSQQAEGQQPQVTFDAASNSTNRLTPVRPEPIRLVSAELPEPDDLEAKLELEMAQLGTGGKVNAQETGPQETVGAGRLTEERKIANSANDPLEGSRTSSNLKEMGAVDHTGSLQLVRTVKSRPELLSEPSILLALASALRDSNQHNAAVSFYRRMNSLPSQSIWRTRAVRELHRAEQQDSASSTENTTNDASSETWLCKRIASRPVLDGSLDDPCWRSATVQPLQNPDGLPPTQIAMTHDDEYLYIAASCPKRAKASYLPKRRPRPRDADLTSLDRLRLSFDINRDYASWWSIEIDHRGWTNESLLGDSSWNPKYYVASGVHDQTWTIEAAIPLDQLSPSEYLNSEWAVGVERIVPESFVERWGQSGGVERFHHQLQGLIRLE